WDGGQDYTLINSLIIVKHMTRGLASGMPDFDNTRNGYEFAYHDTHDLLLTIHDNKCYFAYFEDGSAEEYKLYRHRDQVEDLMIKIIEANDTQAVTPSSLDDVRVKFEDLLADFRCMGLDVYTVVFEGELT
ncbi:hypothetical protein BaRGS_00009800, partial [Batillaria attramentaria]